MRDLATTFLPPVRCESWCEQGDGHPTEMFRTDQNCWTGPARVNLSLHDELLDYDQDASGRWQPTPDHVAVWGWREADGSASFELAHADAPAVHLTTTEARQLRDILTTILRVVDPEP